MRPETRSAIAAILRRHELHWADLTSRSRRVDVVSMRWAVIIYLREERGWSFARIGELLKMDHSSCIHAYRKRIPSYARARQPHLQEQQGRQSLEGYGAALSEERRRETA